MLFFQLLFLACVSDTFVAVAHACSTNADCDMAAGEWCGSCRDNGGDTCCSGACIISEASSHSCLTCSSAFGVPFEITDDCTCLAEGVDDLQDCSDALSAVKFPGRCTLHTDCKDGAWCGYHGLASGFTWSTCSTTTANPTAPCDISLAVGSTCLDCGPPFYTGQPILLTDGCQCLKADTDLEACSAGIVQITTSAASFPLVLMATQISTSLLVSLAAILWY